MSENEEKLKKPRRKRRQPPLHGNLGLNCSQSPNQIELGYDELKTHMLEREEALRSKQPEGVRQEIAGMAIAYNLVRKEMERVARELDLPSTRISFRHALMLIRNFCLAAWAASPGVLPSRLGGLDSELRLLVLPERRPERRYKRHVKVKMSNFPRNRGKSAPAA